MGTQSFLAPPPVPKGKGTGLVFRLIAENARRHPVQMTKLMLAILLTAALWVCEPLYSRYAIDSMLAIKDGAPISYAWIFGWWGALFVALSLTQAIEKYWGWAEDNRLLQERREELYRHVMHLGIAFHSQQKSGEVMKQLDEGADNLVDMQRHLVLELGPSFLSASVFLCFAAAIDWRLTGILLTMVLVFMAIAVTGTVKTAGLQYQVNKLWVKGIGRAYDAVTNILSVQSGAQENREEAIMAKSNTEAFTRQQQVNVRWAFVEAINFFMLTRILLTASGILLYVRGEISLGDWYFFQASFFRVLVPFEMLAGLLPQWNKKVGKIRLSQEILDTPIAIQSTESATTLSNLKGEITFDGMCFSYTQTPVLQGIDDDEAVVEPTDDAAMLEGEVEDVREVIQESEEDDIPKAPEAVDDFHEQHESHGQEVLHNVSLNIRAGEQVAFVGHSGAGKSTLVALLNRFYDVTKGRILIDGVDMKELDVKWWRSQVGLVLQENLMFNDSVLENIRYARPGATEAEVVEAAKRAAAHEFITSLPLGYNTEIGDRGIRLSGGQRQRVAIARAILKQPKIVILDEATSALDSVTERAVQQGIAELIKGRTSIIIAHRLSTVRSVDRIAVLDKGNLLCIAPHEELLKKCDVYREMVELQSHGMLAEE